MLRKASLLIVTVASCAAASVTVAVTRADVLGLVAAKRTSHSTAAKKVHGLAAPRLLAPPNGAHVQQVPTLTWNGVGGAVEYEYQVAADSRFHSIVLGTGSGRGTSTTNNLAASLGKPLTDGTYYWRVRGLTKTKEPGPWSVTRTLTKGWTEAPRLLGPARGAEIRWPLQPLALSWSPVQGATEYIVTIATDPGLSSTVIGSTTSPVKTWGTVFALPGTLAVGSYYWAITPVDAEGHRGARSQVGTFSWAWPTSTTTQLTDIANPFGFEPQFSWAPIAGAAHYEVEVNQSPQFPPGSRWCCDTRTTATSLSPTELLANDHAFYWRVRAIDANGNAGQWNLGAGEHGQIGEGFTEAFDNVTPTVPNLTMSDVNGNPVPPGVKTDTPIVTWSPVPGAASYEVQITRYLPGFGCNWAAEEAFREKQTVDTASLAWTPLGEDINHIGSSAWPTPDTRRGLREEGTEYCVRVLARAAKDARQNKVDSAWTQIGGLNQMAFKFESQPPPTGNRLETQAADYILPLDGSVTPRTPLMTWKRVPGAKLYYVVTARDEAFTDVVDIASTAVPAYAPELEGEEPLADQTNAYFWAVVPVTTIGTGAEEHFLVTSLPPEQDARQNFTKFSVPPTPLAPVGGAEVGIQPTFRWTAAEGAQTYTLQVSQDPTFGNTIDNVRTVSTSYTSTSTYPADVTLYWRVRANDANFHAEGLNWSAVQTFRRTLPVPAPAASNPKSVEAIPVLSWSPVTGATSYDVHVEQPDGTTRDFTLDSPAFTVSEWDGPGVWRWQARAEFPTGSFQQIPGGYFAPQPIAHTEAAPSGAVGERSGARITISWRPEQYAREYEVEISTSDAFTSTARVESQRTEQSSWAPNIELTKPSNRGTLFWRVAAIDNRGNVGPYATGSFVAPKPKAKCATKKVKRGNKTVKVCVRRKKH